jgi:hypothetical protein
LEPFHTKSNERQCEFVIAALHIDERREPNSADRPEKFLVRMFEPRRRKGAEVFEK